LYRSSPSALKGEGSVVLSRVTPRATVGLEEAEHEPIVVKEPAVFRGKFEVLGEMPRQVAHVLARLDIEMGVREAPAGVGRIGLRHAPEPFDAHTI
jgi:hypothetical protein